MENIRCVITLHFSGRKYEESNMLEKKTCNIVFERTPKIEYSLNEANVGKQPRITICQYTEETDHVHVEYHYYVSIDDKRKKKTYSTK